MPSQGPLIAGAGSSVDIGDHHAWTTPGNITALDGSYAVSGGSSGFNGYSDYLEAQSFGFSVPSNSVINGILFEFYIAATAGNTTATFADVVALQAGTGVGTDYGTGTVPAGVTGAPNAWTPFGGSANLWGAAWTPALINAAGFGVELRCSEDANTVNVDAVRATVYYTLTGARMRMMV